MNERKSQGSEWNRSSKRPEQWEKKQFETTPEEWARIEQQEHDKLYKDTYPFGLDGYKFTPEHVLRYEDYAYKKGRRRDRGHRTRKAFELIGLNRLPGKRVLDVGCGIGQYSVFFAMFGAEVTGVDLSPVAVAKAKELAEVNGVLDRCSFRTGSFISLSIPEDHFDVIFLHEVYHHLIKYPGCNEAIFNAAKPGGIIVSCDTLQGGGLVHFGRRLTKVLRHWLNPTTQQKEIQAGDVLLTLEDYEKLGNNGVDYEVHLSSYLYMIKQTALQYHTDKLIVRLVLRLVKYLDDVLFSVLPSMRRRAAEVAMRIDV